MNTRRWDPGGSGHWCHVRNCPPQSTTVILARVLYKPGLEEVELTEGKNKEDITGSLCG